MDKKYDFTKAEVEIQQLWEEKGIYNYQNGRERKVYSIDTPPPTVSGNLHIGHVFSYTQAEMIARFKRMQGYDVFYPFGFDDNGLPTERLVERDEKVRAADLSRDEFREKCLRVSLKYEEEFKELWQSLGFSVDWSLQYRTVSDQTQRISQRSFLDLVKKGKAYLKESPVLWCTECRTSIAQAELDTKEAETTFHYLEFETKKDKLMIATTRPELLYGCVCIFVHPHDERYQDYIGQTAIVPLYEFSVPILADEEVSREKGTGAVMCCTFGDMTDASWYQTHQLPYKQVILPNGTIEEHVPYIGGMEVAKARRFIIEDLRASGKLIKQEIITHSVGVHERCQKAIEIIPSNQWYIEVLSEKERYLQAAEEIHWYPEHMKKRFVLWVENLKWDWCISRQRYFGVPIPVWYCKSCGKPIFAEEDQLPVNPLTTGPRHSCSCGCNEFEPETAVLDTWATSSITPLINAHYGEDDDRSEKILPMSMRCQAHEIIRTWAFYTIVKSLYHTGKLPWNDIMISGFVLAKPGEKISKSKNNSTNTPLALIKHHSADAIRYWAANAKLGTDTFFREEDLKESKRFLTKLWNASSFAIMHLADFSTNNCPDLLPIDQWILQRVSETTKQAMEYLNKYEIGQARKEIDTLFWRDFCDYYIEIIKERLYQPEKHGEEERRSGQYALYHSLLSICKLYAIYTPHITDTIYQQFFRSYVEKTSIHQLLWDMECNIDQSILAFGSEVLELIAMVRKLKSERNMSLKDPMDELLITCPIALESYFKRTEKDILACTNAKCILYDFTM
ncbi:MAG: valine--tRNA ligase [Herbinix sp.]|jgi:valyl-tRNA synthetase|nr:valine--tRNA ligase [Herbinix sp.]